jgi:hypothetical protein
MLPENTESTKEENIASLLETIQGYRNENKTNSIKAFIEGDRSVGITSKNVSQIINDAKITNDSQKVEIFTAFIASKRSVGITSKDVSQMMEDAEMIDDKDKSLIIRAFAIDNLCRGIKEDSDQIKKIETFFNERGESLQVNDYDAKHMIHYYSFAFGVGVNPVKIFVNCSIDNLIKEMEGESEPRLIILLIASLIAIYLKVMMLLK